MYTCPVSPLLFHAFDPHIFIYCFPWMVGPTEISLNIDGKSDPCVKGQDINFKFTGFSVSGLVSLCALSFSWCAYF